MIFDRKFITMVSFGISVAFVNLYGESDVDAQNTLSALRSREVMQLLAQSILNKQNTAVLAEVRYDNAFVDRPKPEEDYLNIILSLNLTEMYPVQVIRGGNLPERIWVQRDVSDAWDRVKIFFHLPNMSREGLWLCFLQPVRKLPRRLPDGSSKLSEELKAYQGFSNPHEVAVKLGFSSWLNKTSWFVPAFDFSLFLTTGKLREIRPSSTLSAYDIDQIQESSQRRKTREKEIDKTQIVLSESELNQIIKLIELFDGPNAHEFVSFLDANDSELTGEIIRKLATSSDKSLAPQAKAAKSILPKKIIERAFSEINK